MCVITMKKKISKACAVIFNVVLSLINACNQTQKKFLQTLQKKRNQENYAYHYSLLNVKETFQPSSPQTCTSPRLSCYTTGI